MATVTSAGPGKIPTLSAGELTIEVFLRWKDACKDYFEIKDIKDEKKVTHAGTGIQDLLVRDWYRSDIKRLRELSWDEFAKEFKSRWLPSDWDVKARNELARRQQKEEEHFKDWVVRMETLNAILKDTTSHKTEIQLRDHIESLLCKRLGELAVSANASSIASYRDWRTKLVTLDNERLANAAEIARISSKTNRASTKPATASSSYNSSFARSSNSINTGKDFPPALTDNERALLIKYNGCFKCRRFFAGHRQQYCKNPSPKRTGYFNQVSPT